MTAPVSQNIVWHEGVTQEQREELTGQRGVTIWFTGLSGQSSLSIARAPPASYGHVEASPALYGSIADHTNSPRTVPGPAASGKSTLACALELELLQRKKRAFRLDGDNVRFGLNKDLGFSPKDREENIRRVGEVRQISLFSPEMS